MTESWGAVVFLIPNTQPKILNAESDPKERGAGGTVCCPGVFGMAIPLALNPTEMQANILRVLKPSQGTARPTGHKAETKSHSQDDREGCGILNCLSWQGPSFLLCRLGDSHRVLPHLGSLSCTQTGKPIASCAYSLRKGPVLLRSLCGAFVNLGGWSCGGYRMRDLLRFLLPLNTQHRTAILGKTS